MRPFKSMLATKTTCSLGAAQNHLPKAPGLAQTQSVWLAGRSDSNCCCCCWSCCIVVLAAMPSLLEFSLEFRLVSVAARADRCGWCSAGPGWLGGSHSSSVSATTCLILSCYLFPCQARSAKLSARPSGCLHSVDLLRSASGFGLANSSSADDPARRLLSALSGQTLSQVAPTS